MSKKFVTGTKVLGLILILSVIFFITEVFALQYFSEKQYQALIANREITQAFFEGNPDNISGITKKYGLDYQRLEGGNISFSTSAALPKPEILQVVTDIGKGVITDGTETALQQIRPRILFLHRKPYISFLLPTQNENGRDGLGMVVIYKSIF